jgi:hypothetical protein
MKVYFEDGLSNWLGTLDKADMEAFSDDDLKQTLGEDMTTSVCPTFYWNGMSTHTVKITGGPELVQEPETGLYRIGKPGEEIEATEERLEEKQENTEQKIEALQNLRKRTRFKKQLNVIEEKINELEATPEEKKVIQQENKEERQRKKELLTDPTTGVEYDNETALKRYNPRLYNKNFGLRSQWFKDHKDEKQVEQKLNKEIRKMEDKQYKYVRRNSDGSLKRTGN